MPKPPLLKGNPVPRKVQPIPKGFHTVTPGLCIHGAARAIEFYKRAFGAREIARWTGAQGKIMHAEIKIGDSRIFVIDEKMSRQCRSPKRLKGTSSAIFLYVKNVDKLFARAVKAGAKVKVPLADVFWGDRHGEVQDPFGHIWALAAHKEDLTRKTIALR